MPIDTTAEDILKSLSERGYRQLANEFSDDYIPTRVMFDLLEKHDSVEVRCFLCSFEDTPTAVIEQICEDEDLAEQMQLLLSQHPRLPVRKMAYLAEQGTFAVKLSLASNANLSPNAAGVLCAEDHLLIRVALAANSAIPNRVREFLFTDAEACVREAAIDRKLAEPELLQLLGDPDAPIRMKAVLERKISREVLQAIADSDDEVLQSFLLERKDIDDSLYASLLLSPHRSIRRIVLKTYTPTPAQQVGFCQLFPDSIGDLIEFCPLHEALQIHLMENEDTAPLLSKLAGLDDLNPQCLKQLARYGDLPVVEVLLERHGLRPEVLETLCVRADKEIVYAVAYKAPRLEQRHLLLLLSRPDRFLAWIFAERGLFIDDLPDFFVEAYLNDSVPLIQSFGLRGMRGAHEQVFEMLMDSPSPLLRRALAEHPELPLLQLQRLLQDGDKSVVTAAEQAWKQRQI